MKQLLFLLLLTASAVPVWATQAPVPQPRTLNCNFDGDNHHQVYKVITAVGVGTTFRLPEGWNIADFVVTVPKFFR